MGQSFISQSGSGVEFVEGKFIEQGTGFVRAGKRVVALIKNNVLGNIDLNSDLVAVDPVYGIHAGDHGARGLRCAAEKLKGFEVRNHTNVDFRRRDECRLKYLTQLLHHTFVLIDTAEVDRCAVHSAKLHTRRQARVRPAID